MLAGRSGVDRLPFNLHERGVSRPDGHSRWRRKAAGEESPGSIDIRCRITSGGGNPRESATENEPLPRPQGGSARVKRCGKSAPRVRRRNRHGKPHREQDRIGTADAGSSRKRQRPRSDVRLAVRVGCSRSRASAIPEEWPSRIVPRKLGDALQNPAYRPADAENEGFGATTPDPSPFSTFRLIAPQSSATTPSVLQAR
jgi:hypothetical protein